MINYKEVPCKIFLKSVYAIFYFNNETDKDLVLNEIKDKPVDKYIDNKFEISFMIPLVQAITKEVILI